MTRHNIVRKRDEKRRSPAIVTMLMAMGIAASLAATGCQTGGAARLSQSASDAPSNLVMRPIIESGRSNDDAPTDDVRGKTKVQMVAFNQAQSGQSEQSEESKQPEELTANNPPSPVKTAPEVTLSETVVTEPFEFIESRFSESGSEYPIDLMTAMRLAGANHLQIALENTQEPCT